MACFPRVHSKLPWAIACGIPGAHLIGTPHNVGVPSDPGNWMLYFAWQLLLARAGACAWTHGAVGCVRGATRGG